MTTEHGKATEQSEKSHSSPIVEMGSAAELVDVLPYLLGYRPEECMVMVAVHERVGVGRFGGRARLGIPLSEEDWPSAAQHMAEGLIEASSLRNGKPDGIVVFLCQDPPARGAAVPEPELLPVRSGGGTLLDAPPAPFGQTGRQVMERLRPLAQLLRTECGAQDVPVVEAICLSEGRYWSYICPDPRCCPPDGTPMGISGASALAAAASFAGLRVRGTVQEFRRRLLPWEVGEVQEQEAALDAAGRAVVPRIVDAAQRTSLAEETVNLGRILMRRLAKTRSLDDTAASDARDDRLIAHDEAAALILGLQDRTTRDCVAEWMEDKEAPTALRLWRCLARRCVGAYVEYAAAPLTLVGWIAWSTGDEVEAREALAMALGVDGEYRFAQLLHEACVVGLDPELLRRFLRNERHTRREAAVRKPPTGGSARVRRPVGARPPGKPGGAAAGGRGGRAPSGPGVPSQRARRRTPGRSPRDRR
ncbi:DUF4192 domain-containing protein [Streptomyces sp. NPDC058045]|uniref:DUF4192 domain-containing protein n=1 Tax=Streptomyces sp. NPDC058045 TaxID=3346311 RepID=UPI0036E5A357